MAVATDRLPEIGDRVVYTSGNSSDPWGGIPIPGTIAELNKLGDRMRFVPANPAIRHRWLARKFQRPVQDVQYGLWT